MRSIITAFFLLSLSLTTFATDPQKPQPAQIQFKGIVSSQGQDLSGVLVSITHLETGTHTAIMTDANGHFTLPIQTLKGTYKIRLSLLGYDTHELRLSAEELHQNNGFRYQLSELQATTSLTGLMTF